MYNICTIYIQYIYTIYIYGGCTPRATHTHPTATPAPPHSTSCPSPTHPPHHAKTSQSPRATHRTQHACSSTAPSWRRRFGKCACNMMSLWRDAFQTPAAHQRTNVHTHTHKKNNWRIQSGTRGKTMKNSIVSQQTSASPHNIMSHCWTHGVPWYLRSPPGAATAVQRG